MVTPNHNYDIPQPGSLNWHEPLNRNFEEIDKDIEIRDKENNLENYEPMNNSKFYATDTGAVYIADGVKWSLTSGKFASVRSPEVAGEYFAREYPGTTLSEKIYRTLQGLPGGSGRVRITQRRDGRPWKWGSELRLDISDYNGVHLDFDENVQVRHQKDGEWTLIIDGHSASSRDGERFTLTGGIFIGNDGISGFCRVQDATLVKISPNTIREYTNSEGDSCGIQLRNKNSFCEDCIVGPMSTDIVDIPIDYEPASLTGGTGTDSYDGCEIHSVTARQTQNVGFRFRGKIQNNVILQPTVFAGSDGVVGFKLNGDMNGTSIYNPKFEPSNPKDDLVAFQTGMEFGHSPMIISPDIVGVSGGKKFDKTISEHFIMTMGMGGGSGIGEPEGKPSDRFVIADGLSNIWSIDNNGLIHNNNQMAIKRGFYVAGGQLNFNQSKIKNLPSKISKDNMSANPEAETEDGFVSVEIGGEEYQIPLYKK